MEEIILYFSLLYNGDFDSIYNALKNKEQVDHEKFISLKNKLNCNYVTILDENYPESLKLINYPPFVLYYYGDFSLTSKSSIAMVGMRNASDYGKAMALKIAENIVKKEEVVVSGMAKGIDTYSHMGCINSGGKTIAVLGCGIDYCYPKENQDLYDILCKDHLVLSEYPFNIKPRKDYFPKRNRIVTGLARKLVVVESMRKGGSMISVGFALEQGKDVYCIPQKYEINDGCNYLISLGAKIILEIEDIFE